MKAIVVTPGHQAPRLVRAEVPEVAIGPAEVLVEVRATAVNRADLLQARGLYPPPPGASQILGLEMAGAITAAGAAVDGWRAGDRVLGLVDGGGYAERAAGGGPHCLDSLMGGISSESIVKLFMKHQAAFANG